MVDVQFLKNKIVEDNKVELILEKLDCHKIKVTANEVRCALPDGDNPTSVHIYIESQKTENKRVLLLTKVYTRNNFPEHGDIISFVEYIKGIYFINAIHWICEVCGYDYYNFSKLESQIDPCVLAINKIEPKGMYSIENNELKKYDENILKDFLQFPHIAFLNDGISMKVQRDFEIGFSLMSDRITIPIRDEIGNLVGVKGRVINSKYTRLDTPKYNYIYPTQKTQILYGINKTYEHIKDSNEVIVLESEKAVMQAWTMGIKNCVSIGGHNLSHVQVFKLEKLDVNIVIAYDKDVKEIDINYIKKECDKFITKRKIYSLWDKDNLLKDKQSPTDKGGDLFKKMLINNKYLVRDI